MSEDKMSEGEKRWRAEAAAQRAKDREKLLPFYAKNRKFIIDFATDENSEDMLSDVCQHINVLMVNKMEKYRKDVDFRTLANSLSELTRPPAW